MIMQAIATFTDYYFSKKCTNKLGSELLADLIISSAKLDLELSFTPKWNTNLKLDVITRASFSAHLEKRIEKIQNRAYFWAYDLNACHTPSDFYSAFAPILKLDQSYNPELL